MINPHQLWLEAPTRAFRDWQENEATGATRRAFSSRSVIQHTAMFERFLRHLVRANVSVATFGEDHLDTFLGELEMKCAARTSTPLRYARLLDRLCRHLVEAGVRRDNPAAQRARLGAWPTGEPVPLFLDAAADQRLQDFLSASVATDGRAVRNNAIVALLLATGITSAEIRRVRRADILISGSRPHLVVAPHGARGQRIVPIAAFAIAPLHAWLAPPAGMPGELLFPLNASTGSFCEETLWWAVREALDVIGFEGADRSARVLRNTYARRQLIAGRTNADVSMLLGLVSQRTVVRLRATITAAPEADLTSQRAP